jgi:hypothetical protein
VTLVDFLLMFNFTPGSSLICLLNRNDPIIAPPGRGSPVLRLLSAALVGDVGGFRRTFVVARFWRDRPLSARGVV